MRIVCLTGILVRNFWGWSLVKATSAQGMSYDNRTPYSIFKERLAKKRPRSLWLRASSAAPFRALTQLTLNQPFWALFPTLHEPLAYHLSARLSTPLLAVATSGSPVRREQRSVSYHPVEGPVKPSLTGPAPSTETPCRLPLRRGARSRLSGDGNESLAEAGAYVNPFSNFFFGRAGRVFLRPGRGPTAPRMARARRTGLHP